MMNVLMLEGLLEMLRKRLERLKVCLEILLKYIILKEKGKIQILWFSEFIYIWRKKWDYLLVVKTSVSLTVQRKQLKGNPALC